jgi:hypothetical protein
MTWGVVALLQQTYEPSCLAQRALAARWAIEILSSFESFAARARPPFCPPSLPNATAAGFFFLAFAGKGIGCLDTANGAPMAASTTRKAFWATSPLLDRLCMPYNDTRLMPNLDPEFSNCVTTAQVNVQNKKTEP